MFPDPSLHNTPTWSPRLRRIACDLNNNGPTARGVQIRAKAIEEAPKKREILMRRYVNTISIIMHHPMAALVILADPEYLDARLLEGVLLLDLLAEPYKSAFKRPIAQLGLLAETTRDLRIAAYENNHGLLFSSQA